MYKIEKIETDKYGISKIINEKIEAYAEGSRLKILEVAIDLRLQKASVVFKMLDSIGHNTAEWAEDGQFLRTSSTWYENCGILLH